MSKNSILIIADEIRIMKKVKLTDVTINKHTYSELYVFYDNNNELVILPLLFSLHLCKTGEVFVDRVLSTRDRKKNSRFVTEKSLVESAISDNTISTYLSHLLSFLQYIEDQTLPGDNLVNQSELIDDDFINFFLNSVYSNRVTTLDSLKGMKSSLLAYFNFLTNLGINSHKSLKITKNTRRRMLEKESENFSIKYVRSSYINSLILASESLSDELIIRFGFELGLRASECTGLLLEGPDGLSPLIEQYEKEQDALEKQLETFPMITETFEYVLRGRYTKGGKSRVIFIPRSLIALISKYKKTERDDLLELSGINRVSTLLLCRAASHLGQPISKKYATTVFRRLKQNVPELKSYHTFHCLRHTYATRLYDQKIRAGEGKNEALRHVAIRLGHALSIIGEATSTTIRYVFMRDYMLSVERAY